jgi:SAM-dependent methyltransferase
MEDNNYRNETNNWLASMNLMGSVVDIGGGKRTAKSRLGSHTGIYKILDRGEYKGKSLNPDIKHDINYSLNIKEKFDIAFMLFMFEFVFDPVQCFENISNLLYKGGRFYFNAPYFMPTECLVEEDYYRVTKNGIHKLLRETGFEAVDIIRHSGEFTFYLVEARKI